jgi:thiol-disulfide isomerase/thioredoxin
VPGYFWILTVKTRLIFLLLVFCPAVALAQHPEIDLHQLKNRYAGTDTTVFVYMTAQWCKPCLDKMPALDAYFTATKRPYRLYYLFDRDKFQEARLSKVFPHINFSGSILMAPQQFYPTGSIQINGHRKMLSEFKSYYAASDLGIQHLDRFDLGMMIVYKPGTGYDVIECPGFSPGSTLANMDSAWDNALR